MECVGKKQSMCLSSSVLKVTTINWHTFCLVNKFVGAGVVAAVGWFLSVCKQEFVQVSAVCVFLIISNVVTHYQDGV